MNMFAKPGDRPSDMPETRVGRDTESERAYGVVLEKFEEDFGRFKKNYEGRAKDQVYINMEATYRWGIQLCQERQHLPEHIEKVVIRKVEQCLGLKRSKYGPLTDLKEVVLQQVVVPGTVITNDLPAPSAPLEEPKEEPKRYMTRVSSRLAASDEDPDKTIEQSDNTVSAPAEEDTNANEASNLFSPVAPSSSGGRGRSGPGQVEVVEPQPGPTDHNLTEIAQDDEFIEHARAVVRRHTNRVDNAPESFERGKGPGEE